MWETQPYALWGCKKCGATNQWGILPPGTQLVCTNCKNVSPDFQIAPATTDAIFHDPAQAQANNVPSENNAANNVTQNASGKGNY